MKCFATMCIITKLHNNARKFCERQLQTGEFGDGQAYVLLLWVTSDSCTGRSSSCFSAGPPSCECAVVDLTICECVGRKRIVTCLLFSLSD